MDKDRLKEYMRIYRQKNKEKLSEQAKENYKLNRKILLVKQKEYYENNKDHCKKYSTEWGRKNKDKRRLYRTKDKHRVRRELLLFLGNICIICGTTERIEIDHKQAGGCVDRIKKGNNWNMYRYYLKHPEEAKEKLQLLCKTHNLHKENINGERWPQK
jgi:hypothetical protein